MAHPYHHALSSARRFGGTAEDYLPVHSWFDESKLIIADYRHRALRHHARSHTAHGTPPPSTIKLAAAAPRRERHMKPRFIEIDGKRHLWADILELRREQLAAWHQARQPALFDMRLDVRPAAERRPADRYLEPSLFGSDLPSHHN